MIVSDYIKTDGRRFIQYNMWKNCRNGCDFCFNRGFKKSDIQEQLEIIEFTRNKLLSPEQNEYNEIGFIGGEFFDNQLENQEVKEGFYNLFEICAKKYKEGKINKICVATSLVFDMNKELYPFVRFLESLKILDITLFCTSYDTKYRFHSYEKLLLWQNNMLKLRQMLRNKIHTEIIVTQFFIDDVMNGRFNIPEFMKRFDTSIDYIEPTFIDYFPSREASIAELPDFFPRRSSFLKFVKEMCFNRKWIDISRFLSIKLRSDTSYYKLADGSWTKIDDRWKQGIRRIDKYGNAKEIFSYCDSDKKMTDDVLILAGGSDI